MINVTVTTVKKRMFTVKTSTLYKIGFLVYLSAYLCARDIAIIKVGGFAIYSACVFLGFIFELTDYKKEVFKTKYTMAFGIVIWFCAFFGYAFFSAVWALEPSKVFTMQNAVIQIGLVMLYLCYTIRSIEEIFSYLKLVVWANLVSVIVIFALTPIDEWGSGRIGPVVGWHENDVGLHLAFAAVIAFYFAVRKHKPVYLALAVLLGGIMLFTGSRQSLVVLMLGMFMYAVLFSKNILITLRNLVITIGIVIIVGIIIFNVKGIYDVLGTRIEDLIAQFLGDTDADGSAVERGYFANKALEAFGENPVFGMGLSNFSVYLSKIGYTKVTWSHNNYLELMSGLGIVGLIIYYSYLVYVEVYAVRLLKYRCDCINMTLILMTIYLLVDFVAVNLFLSYGYIFYTFCFIAAKMLVQDIRNNTHVSDKKSKGMVQ